ncbi:MAG: DUF465 domain-containing protein [Thermoanaerobaculia bacterium]|jgi:uncharacterized protein YdcH (DUF465 family)
MAKTPDSLREELLATNEEFRSLYDRHQDCERRLIELHQKSLLSEKDELEEKQIKRQKLFLKDQMEAILRQRRTEEASA